MARKKSPSQRKYSKTAQKEVAKEMRLLKKGKAHSGKALAPVESREQAIAIGLSKARKKGEKVPKKASGSATRSRKTTATKAKSTKTKSRSKKAASSRSRSH